MLGGETCLMSGYSGPKMRQSAETNTKNVMGEKYMSFVTTQPEALTAAAGSLADIGSAMSATGASVAPPTTGLVPAAADEVSALTAAAFAAHGVLYQEVSAQAAAIHQLFVTTLEASAGSYAATEAANVAATR